MKRLVLAMTAVSISALLAGPAFGAQNVCGKRADIVARLHDGYQEFNSAMGVATNGGLIELYTSEKGTWTLMLTQPDGVSCLIAAGNNWESLNKPKAASETF